MRKLLLLLWPILTLAQTPSCTTNVCNAATPGENDVINALPSTSFGWPANSSVTVNIPSGSGTWTTSFVYTIPANVTTLNVIGAGNQSVIGGGDVTTFVDNVSHTSDNAMLQFNTGAASTIFRFSGVTFSYTGNATTTFQGSFRIFGFSQNIRVDHVHFNKIADVAGTIGGWTYGVIDHCLFDGNAPTWNGIKIDGSNYGGPTFLHGDGAWNDDTNLGTNKFIFFENNTFNFITPNDCNNGGRFVARFNTETWPAGLNSTGGGWQGHATGSAGDRRGCRAFEVYNNTLTINAASTIFVGVFQDTGVSVIYGNNITGKVKQDINLVNDRSSNGTYTQQPTPTGWGYCGTFFNGTGSNWDQNTDAPSGYACIDQLGRGKGDLLSGNFPNKQNNTNPGVFTGTWPHQVLEPLYIWNEVWPNTASGAVFLSVQYGNGNVTVTNRDYYTMHDSTGAILPFDGTTGAGKAGVGSGLLSARPATCTPQVAWWATDTSTLYKCTAVNTWTTYYTPFTYPHPLVNGPTVAIPTFSPSAGSYLTAQTVSITSSTVGATICYTNDGSTPTANGGGTCTHGTTLTNGGTATVTFTQLLRAIGTETSFSDSGVGSAQYTFPVASAPTSMAGK